MKKTLILAAVVLVAASATTVKAEENATVNATAVKRENSGFVLPGNQWRIGLDTIFAGRIQRDENGAPQYLYGVTAGLGFGFRYYFTIKDELQAVHPYAEGGTTTVIYPYFGGGIEYDLPNGDDPAGNDGVFSIGGGVYFFSKLFGAEFMPFPFITVSYSFK
ncbi:hypothetical protein [Desulfurobacterium sp.]